MSTNFLFRIVLLFTALQALGQTFPIDTILYNGSTDNRVNLVLLGDGYTASEQDKFVVDAENITKAFLLTEPYKQYANYLNVFAVKVVSAESGAGHKAVSSDNGCGGQPVKTVNNYFGSAFDGGGQGSYHRLLVATKYSNITSVLAANFPNYDQALIVVNTPYYGGSGGTMAVTSTDASANEIAIHEVGHSFSFLADEYWAGSQYATNAKPNMTNVSDPATIKWKAWLNLNGIGIYPHSESPSYYRPHQSCKMRYLGYPFCSVCQEAHIEKIHSLTNAIDAYTPSNKTTVTVSDKQKFALTLVAPIPNTLKASWTLNGNLVAKNVSAYELSATALAAGSNVLKATVVDTTGLSKATTHPTQHVYQVQWTIQKSTTTGFDITPEASVATVRLYPNPSVGNTKVAYVLEKATQVSIHVLDASGNAIYATEVGQSAGEYEHQIPSAYLKPGLYLVQVALDGVHVLEDKLLVQ